jgi:hypothetical protein
MVTTFLRPASPPSSDAPVATNVALHERLKDRFTLPVGIATGYELECHALLEPGDRLRSVERIADIGDERDTRFGRGRDWVIEVVSSITDGPRAGALACVERWRMTGYDPARIDPAISGSTSRSSASHSDDDVPIGEVHRRSFPASREMIVAGAVANRVWASAHHDDAAAIAAGLPGIILDTSSWVAITSVHAAAATGGDPRIGSVDLQMRRPVLVDDVVELEGTVVADTIDHADVRWAIVEVTARVRDRIGAVAIIRLAVASADRTDVWSLAGERWRPASP